MSATTLSPADNQVGTRRRRELGAIDPLAQSIADVGLLHPVVVTLAGQLRNESTDLYAPVRAHSAKPNEFYRFVESPCPAPRHAELFQRTEREGSDGHGDEVQRGAVW